MGDVATWTTAPGRWFGRQFARLRRQLGPDLGLVKRVAWMAWAFNLLLFATLILLTLLVSSVSWQFRVAIAAALVGAMLWEGAALRAGRFPLWADVLETAAVVLLAWGIPDYPPKLIVAAFALPGLGYRCLYGGLWQAAARTAATLAAIFAGRLIFASADDLYAEVRAVLPLVLPAAFVAMLCQGLTRTLRHEEALLHRQRVRARLNRDLIAARRPAEVYEAILDAVLDLFGGQPGVRAIVWDESSGPGPVAARGDRAEEALAARPKGAGVLPTWIREAIVAGEPVYQDPTDFVGVRQTFGFDPLPGVTLVVPLQRRQELRTLSVGSERPIPPVAQREIASYAKVVEIAFESLTLNERLRESQEALRQRSYYDPLTRLANRDLLRLRLDWAFARPNRDFALLLVDLDQFKTINDSLGHVAGDEALVAVAGRLAGCARPGDTVARLGGDEFAIFMDRLEEPAEAERVARCVLEVLDAPLTGVFNRGSDVYLRGSVGLALSGPAARTPSDLMRNADVAMYAAKTAGGAVYRVFEPAMRASILDRLELEADLNHAIERGELVLHYQPIVNLKSWEVVVVEALVRWNHPQRGMVPPSRFIPVAEESGVIEAIGAWALEESCRQLREWSAIPELSKVRMGVNLSPRQLAQPDFARRVSTIIAEAGIDPSRIGLELTEGALVEHTEASLSKLRTLNALGARLAIDDFGTGFSSLSYLRRFPFDVLKIDRAFVHRVDVDEDAAALASAIISMARALGLECVAEGVERPGEARWLRDAGCGYGQGFLFTPALPPEQLASLLSSKEPWFSGQR
jgi:diguanylate cyclase (GGDEF)-like protein